MSRGKATLMRTFLVREYRSAHRLNMLIGGQRYIVADREVPTEEVPEPPIRSISEMVHEAQKFVDTQGKPAVPLMVSDDPSYTHRVVDLDKPAEEA